MSLNEKVTEWVNQAFSAKTDEEVQASKIAFDQLNASLTEEEKREAGNIMRQLMAERRERRMMKPSPRTTSTETSHGYINA